MLWRLRRRLRRVTVVHLLEARLARDRSTVPMRRLILCGDSGSCGILQQIRYLYLAKAIKMSIQSRSHIVLNFTFRLLQDRMASELSRRTVALACDTPAPTLRTSRLRHHLLHPSTHPTSTHLPTHATKASAHPAILEQFNSQ